MTTERDITMPPLDLRDRGGRTDAANSQTQALRRSYRTWYSATELRDVFDFGAAAVAGGCLFHN